MVITTFANYRTKHSYLKLTDKNRSPEILFSDNTIDKVKVLRVYVYNLPLPCYKNEVFDLLEVPESEAVVNNSNMIFGEKVYEFYKSFIVDINEKKLDENKCEKCFVFPVYFNREDIKGLSITENDLILKIKRKCRERYRTSNVSVDTIYFNPLNMML